MWRTNKVDDKTLLIQAGDVVVGSIVRKNDKWCVEIMAFDGDIKYYVSTDQLAAVSFMVGVDLALAAAREYYDPLRAAREDHDRKH